MVTGAVSQFGFANAFGVFQAYYENVIPGVNQSSIAWIGSLQVSNIYHVCCCIGFAI